MRNGWRETARPFKVRISFAWTFHTKAHSQPYTVPILFRWLVLHRSLATNNKLSVEASKVSHLLRIRVCNKSDRNGDGNLKKHWGLFRPRNRIDHEKDMILHPHSRSSTHKTCRTAHTFIETLETEEPPTLTSELTRISPSQSRCSSPALRSGEQENGGATWRAGPPPMMAFRRIAEIYGGAFTCTVVCLKMDTAKFALGSPRKSSNEAFFVETHEARSDSGSLRNFRSEARLPVI